MSRILTAAIFLSVFLLTGNFSTRAETPAEAGSADSQLFNRLNKSGDELLTDQEIEESDKRLFARLVRKGDRDGDGALSESEFVDALESSRIPKPLTEMPNASAPGADAARALLLLMDTKPDGVIHRDEVPKKFVSIFDVLARQADTNKNKIIDSLELARGGPQVMRAAIRAAARLDINVERELRRFDAEQGELAKRFDEPPNPRQMLNTPQRAAVLFDSLDANGDKRIDSGEFPTQAAANYQRILTTFDADGDEALSEQEFRRAAQRIGQLQRGGERPGRSDPESPDKKPPTAKPTQPKRIAKEPGSSSDSVRAAQRIVGNMVRRLDKNDNGQLEAGEINGRQSGRLRRADLNGDGALDADEILAMKSVLAERLNQRPRD